MPRLFAFVLCLVLAAPAAAQDRERTLADIRQEMSVLYVELQRLKRELVTTGSPSVNITGTSALDRIDSIEAQLTRLISRTEALENRVAQIVADGTNRLGDLEFRLVELEGGDVSQLGETSTLGGEAVASAPLPPVQAQPAPSAPPAGQAGPQLAMSEQIDFDKARELIDSGDYQGAAVGLASFVETYPGSPLAGEAHFWRGEALSALGQTPEAARAYLDSFSGDPQGMMAPDALLQLGLSLGKLGQATESCVMLSEVTARFPASAASLEAQAARGEQGCV